MNQRIPTSVLSIIEAKQIPGEKLTTLKCRMTGLVKPFTKCIIYPGEKELQVKEIFKEDGDFYTVKVKGIPFKNCKRFSVITPVELQVQYGKRAYFIPKDFHSKDFYNGDYYITGGIFSGYRIFNKDKASAKVTKVGSLYSVDFPFRAPLVPGAEYFFENNKGFKGVMNLIYPGSLNKKNLNIINSRVEKFRVRPGVKGIYSIILRTNSFVKLPFFLENEDFEGSIKLSNGRAMEREFGVVKSKIVRQSKASGGVQVGNLKKKLDIESEFFSAVVDSLKNDNLVSIYEDYVVYAGDNRHEYLSPLAKEAYKQIIEAEESGISIRTIKNPGLVRCFKEVERMGLVIVLDSDLFLLESRFNILLDKLFLKKSVGDRISIQDTREATGLSRRYIISLFKILEDRGILDRELDDERIIKKIP